MKFARSFLVAALLLAVTTISTVAQSPLLPRPRPRF
jgi:hypothetical protein